MAQLVRASVSGLRPELCGTSQVPALGFLSAPFNLYCTISFTYSANRPIVLDGSPYAETSRVKKDRVATFGKKTVDFTRFSQNIGGV